MPPWQPDFFLHNFPEKRRFLQCIVLFSLALKESTESTGLSGALRKVEEGEEKKAFLWIEEKMGNDRMRWIHNFLLEAQTLGGDIEDSLDLMLMEVQQIKERKTRKYVKLL